MPCLNRPKAQHKMKFARRRSIGDIGNLQDPEVSPITERRIILAFVTVELGAHLKILAPFVLPLQGSGAEVKMDRLEPVSQSPDISQASHHPLESCCSKSFASSSSSASNGPVQSQNRGSVNRRTKAATTSNRCSQHNCNLSNDSSGSGLDASIGTGSTGPVKDVSKVDMPTKRSSRKKVKKKGRQHKKHSSSCISDIGIAGEQDIHEISVLETCSNSGADLGNDCSLENNLSENETPLSDTLQEIIMETINNEESSIDTVNLSATTSKTTSCSDDVELLETAASLPQESADDEFGSNRLGVDERSLFVSTSANKSTKVTLSGFGGDVLDAHLKQNNTLAEITSILLSDDSTSVFESFSDEWNSDGGANRSDDVNNLPPLRKENVIHQSDRGVVLDCSNRGTSFHDETSGKGHSSFGTIYDSNNGIANSHYCSSKLVANTNNNSDKTRCGGQGCSNSDSFSAVSGKKSRRGRKSSVSSNGMQRLGSGVNMHCWAGKEINHSVRQKIQETDVDTYFFEPKDRDPFCSQFDASKEGSLIVRQDKSMGLMENDHENVTKSACLDEVSAQIDAVIRSATTDADIFSLKSEYGSSGNKISEKLKRESSGSKQGNSHNFKKCSHNGKSTSVRPTKMNVPQKEALSISLPVNNYNSIGAGARSSDCFSTDSFNCSSPEPLQYSQSCSGTTRLLENVIAVASNMDAQASQNRTSTLSAGSDSMEQLAVESDSSSKSCEDETGDSIRQTCSEDGPAELETHVSQVESSKPDHKCGSILQKGILVSRIDVETSDNLSNFPLDDLFSDRTKKEQLSTESLCHVPLTNAGVTCLVPSSGSVNYIFSEDELTSELRYLAPGISKEHSSRHIASNNRPIHKSNEQDIETDSSKISRAVNDAYRMQIESEGVQLETGSPLAEFERLLHSASPIIVQTYNNCSGDQLIGDSLCRREIPTISLGSFWKWYEMPGSYGLEVKAEDYHYLKRFGSDRFQFCAYFVPFLSAVQLFGHSRSSVRACSAMPNNDSSLPVNSMSTSNSLSESGQDQVCKSSVSSACVCDSELLFEYFESEQPQQRRPLFEKIQELVRGNATSNNKIFGDPLKLECLHLHDLHPSSWYSVAWYPIYRIPDGNFRAAFLTYHSLGHFIHRRASSDYVGGGTSVVSPVVGLQSYNVQGECWFQPRKFIAMQMEGSPRFDPSEVMKERLRTLEQTAHVMARASVRKGDQIFVNRQPDYEFFLSRR